MLNTPDVDHATGASTTDPRYPLGPFVIDPAPDDTKRRRWIDQIDILPDQLDAAVHALGPARVDTPYRAGGWTARQVVHHIADSHLNGYVRSRWLLTEDAPAIKLYEQTKWAALPDARQAPPELSLALVRALHARWTVLFRALDPDEFRRTLRHPQSGDMSLDALLQLYAWHGRHHTAHIVLVSAAAPDVASRRRVIESETCSS